jgi:ribonuclease R
MPKKKSSGPPRRLPSKQELRTFLAQYQKPPPLAEVARAFHVHGEDRRELKRLLRDVTPGRPSRDRSNSREGRGRDLPPVSVIDITGMNEDGELIATPAGWNDERRVPPMIIIRASREGQAGTLGDRALARISRGTSQVYYGTVIRLLPVPQAQRVLGMVTRVSGGALISPVSRKDNSSYFVASDDLMDAEDEELVEIAPLPHSRAMGDKPAKVVARIGRLEDPNAASRIAVHRHEIPTQFSEASIHLAESAPAPVLGGRTDLRHIPLITIDGEDARDFDDAVFAEPDTDPGNPGGWHLLVAIADVAHYVRSGAALDRDAFERGNSVYFPDFVVPMLPEALSNGLCSLKPDEDRYCLAVHLWITAEGETIRHHFVRGLMRSHGRWTYTKVQEAYNELSLRGAKRRGNPDTSAGLLRSARNDDETIITNLYGAYAALQKHIEKRAPLDLNLPEHKVKFDAQGRVIDIYKVQRLDAHRLIEAYMIAANVAAADTLSHHRMGAIFRVHEAPDLAKLTTLKEMLKGSHYSFSTSGRIEAAMFNNLLRQAEQRDEAATIHTTVLRSQMQAYYAPQNVGHFGLSLESYCHFTSPIRRYSDLIVHRALISIYNWGDDGMTPADLTRLEDIGEHISTTERRAMQAEREAMERYTVAYLAAHTGAEFAAHISGINQYGLFVELSENGAQGFVPRGALSDDFYTFDPKRVRLTGRRFKREYRLGQPLRVILDMADILTGSLRFVIVESDHRRSAPMTSAHRKRHRGKR